MAKKLKAYLLDRLDGKLRRLQDADKVLTFQLSRRDHRYPDKFIQIVPNEHGGLQIRGGLGRLRVIPQAANVIEVYYE